MNYKENSGNFVNIHHYSGIPERRNVMKERKALYDIDVTCPFCGATGSEKITGTTNVVVECPFCDALASITVDEKKKNLKIVWKIPDDIKV
jgi:hypothetical protein